MEKIKLDEDDLLWRKEKKTLSGTEKSESRQTVNSAKITPVPVPVLSRFLPEAPKQEPEPLPETGENTPEEAGNDTAALHLPEQGAAVGAYQLQSEGIPAGSFVFFRAYHANLDTCRTLEFLSDTDATGIRTFLKRARLAAAANAPNLRSVIEVGEEQESGFFYAVVENTAPRNLRGIAGYGRLSTAQTARLMADAADALCAIERAALCHGALSPELILFSEDYRSLKIAGLELGQNLTLSSVPRAAYSAPECSLHRQGDIRSDLYSLGVIFYEAVTGKLPPPGKRGYIGADPREASGNIAGALAIIIMRLLSLEPEARYSSASEFAAAVHAAQAECLSAGSDKIAPAPGCPDEDAAAPGFLPEQPSLLPVGVEATLLLAWKILCGILFCWLLIVSGCRIAEGLQKLPIDTTEADRALKNAQKEAEISRALLEKTKRRTALIAEAVRENEKQ